MPLSNIVEKYKPYLKTDVAEKHLIIATKFTNFQLGQHCVIETQIIHKNFLSAINL
jgi:hypothetical protein